MLVHGCVPWIAFAMIQPRSSLTLAFLPMPLRASPPPEPFVVVPLSLLERPIESAMIPAHLLRGTWLIGPGSRVGDLAFNFED